MGQSTNSGAARLGTRLRGNLASEYALRGHQTYSLWYVYSPKTNRDWVLAGDLAWAHFLLVESTPGILAVDYSSQHIETDCSAGSSSVRRDAVVTFADGAVEWRRISIAKEELGGGSDVLATLASSRGARYALYTERELFACPQHIQNWSRVVAWLAAVRGRSLQEEMMFVAALVDARGSVTIAEIQDGASASDGACRIAAAFQAIQDGVFTADLDSKPLCKNTRIQRIEHPT